MRADGETEEKNNLRRKEWLIWGVGGDLEGRKSLKDTSNSKRLDGKYKGLNRAINLTKGLHVHTCKYEN